jgi:hypothetical protein
MAAEPAQAAMGNFDSHRLNRLLFGAYYESDIYDRLCGRFPAAARLLSWRIEPSFLARRLIFIHVPRAAGMSVAEALGARRQSHYSMRYYRAVHPRFAAEADSFAVLRDPFERFLSAYAIVRAGGAEGVRLSEVFARATAHVRSVDDYLAFLEARPPLERDHVMRPQSWYVTDLATGEVLVKRLFLLGAETEALENFLAGHGAGPLGWLNRSSRESLSLTPEQGRRIFLLYRQDFELIGRLRAARAGNGAAARRQAAE